MYESRTSTDDLFIDTALPTDAPALFDMVERVADDLVCRDFNPGGPEEFYGAVRMLLYDRPEGHLLLAAKRGDVPIGLVDLRDNYHICLFFVDHHEQKKGVGRALFDEMCRRIGPALDGGLEVYASLYAVPIYEKLGFRQTSGVQLKNGIRFVEMIYDARAGR